MEGQGYSEQTPREQSGTWDRQGERSLCQREGRADVRDHKASKDNLNPQIPQKV